ncbi:hypothetical protein PAXRUDRAFT_699823 [Paxillus rubicundulus Ve08.2h10]|uniref:Uncharacterized protein n=1 Tax=Paxillus rubicundulus Ve08.2h10 TaxID=930991 RepID=A0A0D0E2N3_9AGAM|nr:hypothetical protein PAXRUDRAFT_699823 [Paxillus rubicundulus Ve08.2h10]
MIYTVFTVLAFQTDRTYSGRGTSSITSTLDAQLIIQSWLASTSQTTPSHQLPLRSSRTLIGIIQSRG